MTEEALRSSEKALKRMAEENAIVAEIGRIISSTLDLNEVYERFAEEVRKLISFDRININIFDHKKATATAAYSVGSVVPGRQVGAVFPLAGSAAEEVIRTRCGLLLNPENESKLEERFPGLLPSFQAGHRSMMVVPLISKDNVIGNLYFGSTKRSFFTERDLKLAENIGAQIAGAIANAELFSAQKRTEEALRESQRLLKKTFASLRDALFIIDAESVQILDCNPAASEIFGYSREEFLGQTTAFLHISEEALQEFREHLYDCVGRKGFLHLPEFKMKRKNGLIFFTEHTVMPLEDDLGTRMGWVSVVRDITERKRAEAQMAALQEQFRQSQKIEAVGRLAGGIAHDFNNLLTVIQGYCQISLLELREQDPLKPNLLEIEKASRRAAALTRQLLAFSRRQIMEMRVVDLNTILLDLDKMLRRILGEDIELVTRFAENLERVKVDPGQIEQVILNLAVNARDAMPTGGKLIMETANEEEAADGVCTDSERRKGRYAVLSISDTGCGMAQEVKEQIFEPFFTTKDKGKGTGLGLSTVYGIVKQSGGEILVHSELGKGTTFKIYLPRVEEASNASLRRDESGFLPWGRETILLAEDEPSIRDLAVRVLRRQGYTVLEAANGKEALSVADAVEGRIHLLLTDVVMPEMGGKELAERLKGLRPEMKVLFATGYTSDAIVHHGILDPSTALLQKPFSIGTLTRKVRDVLDG